MLCLLPFRCISRVGTGYLTRHVLCWIPITMEQRRTGVMIRITNGDRTTELAWDGAPVSVSRLLERAGLHPDRPCGGQGRCGKCRVLARGDLSPAAPEERAPAAAAPAAPVLTRPAAFRRSRWCPWRPTACWSARCARTAAPPTTTAPAP